MRTASTSTSGSKLKEAGSLKHKRRFCKVEGCCRIVKSQGVCQRHGAKSAKCKIAGCTKQAQGSHRGMCKAHAREARTNHPSEACSLSSSSSRQLLCQSTDDEKRNCLPSASSPESFAPRNPLPHDFEQIEDLALDILGDAIQLESDVLSVSRSIIGSTPTTLAAYDPRKQGTRFESIVLGKTCTNPNTTLILDYYDHGSMPAFSGRKRPLSRQAALLW